MMSVLNDRKRSVVQQSVIESPSSREMRHKAHRICSEFLGGTWAQISPSEMIFKSVSGGLSNILYCCGLPQSLQQKFVGSTEPHHVLLRLYGQSHSDVLTELVIFTLLSERNLGPKLYGIFPEGRLEEYLSARAVTVEELMKPEISCIIAKKIANIHSLEVPVVKCPRWLFKTCLDWLVFIEKNVTLDSIMSSTSSKATKRVAIELLTMFNYRKEIEWLQNIVDMSDSPIVFSHNDLQQGNILIPEHSRKRPTLEDRIVFIDFEYCSYNYRGFDIANHFCEWCFDYNDPSYPHFTANSERFPSIDEQRMFVRQYIHQLKRINKREKDLVGGKILEELQPFIQASHLLWTLWAIKNAHTSQIKFGYWEYARTRLSFYLDAKKKFVDSRMTVFYENSNRA
ncbi:Choline/ethanolamine kinase [Fragariocoptes setiger]|uniref:Choline/ethanolamine kinase n=1 Tax=Fragariocoptes setiger TaxID=1670756 RepID=A0ABQ7SC96_9ACAR|nr:Choline/ethanolamine kinase [Fragariocoptes setiger]